MRFALSLATSAVLLGALQLPALATSCAEHSLLLAQSAVR